MFLLFMEFIGRFHPVLVHVPIGILLLAGLFQILIKKEKYTDLQPAIGISLFWGMLGAVASCISGFLLSRNGEYDIALINTHQWFGIAVAVVSAIAWLLNKKKNSAAKWVIALMLLLVIITGHLGGSITHGSDYLTKAFTSGNNSADIIRKPIPNIQEAVLYNDLVKPLLESRCYSCHGPNKQKGKLRLDEPAFILKGGKDGKIIIPGSVEESHMIERISLSVLAKDHMPPKEKPQLTKQDIELLQWWVSHGADFHKRVKDLPQTEKIIPVLMALQSGTIKNENKISDIPAAPVEKAAESIIQKLKERGVAVIPVAQNSNYLSANFIAVDSINENDLKLLGAIKKQLIWLKLSDSKITDADIPAIAKLSALTKLYLEKTAVTDREIGQLKSLSQLQYLNITGTNISIKGIEQLKDLKQFQQLFIFNTAITGREWEKLKAIFPITNIDTGGYKLIFLTGDTTELTAPIFNKK